jgi:uncharacterized protein YebE (UPF0316 family)
VILFGWAWLGGLTLLPLLIFVAELCVVTISTLRIIFVSRGRKYLAPLLGFFEITVWLFAIGQIMQNLNDLSCYLAFAGGFTLGNFLGVIVEKKLALGSLVVRIITHKDTTDLIERLQSADYGVTRIDAEGSTGPVQVVLTVIKRRELDRVLGIIHRFDSRVFYSIDDLQSAAEGIAPVARERARGLIPSFFRLQRAG